MTDIRKSLNALADSIEAIENRPEPTVKIHDRELSGNKINGGLITNFSSVGIKDNASRETIVTVKDDGIHVSVAHIDTINNALNVKGNLKVDGEIHAKKLHVDEVSADVRNERTSPLEFKGGDKPAYGKGIIWTGGKYTKQFILQGSEDRLWSTEDLDLATGKSYRINNIPVISETGLGPSVAESNLKKVGPLRELNVVGDLTVDYFLRYDSGLKRFSLGAEAPPGMFTLESQSHQFVIDPQSTGDWKLGTHSTGKLSLITDDTARISIDPTGAVTIHNKTVVQGKMGIGVKNFIDDADLTVAGPIRMQDKKFEVSNAIPTSGVYKKGDIVWNSEPKSGGTVGWICLRDGTPGEWKSFGNIS